MNKKSDPNRVSSITSPYLQKRLRQITENLIRSAVPRQIKLMCLGCGVNVTKTISNQDLGTSGFMAAFWNSIYFKEITASYTTPACNNGEQLLQAPGGFPPSAVAHLSRHANLNPEEDDVQNFVEKTIQLALERWRKQEL